MTNFFSRREGRSALTCALICLASTVAVAQNESESRPYEWSVTYITEGGWNVADKRTSWCNLLEVGGALDLWKGARVEATALGTFRAGCPLADDLQGLSNIDPGFNRAFRLIQGGISQQLGDKVILFAGLRNVDTDHFTSPLTGLFTGSSNGNFPVLSGNFPLGTYPMAALALHAEYRPTSTLTLKETVYNGVADDRLEHQFCFRPDKDGVFNIGSLTYESPADTKLPGSYTVGYGLGTQPIEDEDDLSYNYALWLLGEQQVARVGGCGLGVMVQGGMSPAGRSACRYYWGGGLTLAEIGRCEATVGVAMNRAIYSDGTETDWELTAHVPVWKCFAVQPALHCIRTNGETTVAGLLRLCVELGSE